MKKILMISVILTAFLGLNTANAQGVEKETCKLGHCYDDGP
jgi:hypothetical protein